MTVREIRPVTIFAVLIALSAALIARSWLQVHLRQTGLSATVAADLSYLLVPATLVLFLFPLWTSEKGFIVDQLRASALTWRLALRAIVIGLLIRLLWWSQLIAGTSFGVYSSPDDDAVVGPVFSFQCASPGIVLLGVAVMALLVPIIEEFVHRAYVQTALQERGAFVAILVSALAFAFFHRQGSWPFVFLAGVVLGVQYWVTGNLWSSLISHATINGLIQVDWRCLSGQWNPPAAEIPVLAPGFAAAAMFVAGLIALLSILRAMATEAPLAPR